MNDLTPTTIPPFLEDRLQRIESWIRDLHIRTGGFAPPPPPPEPTAAELEAAHPANIAKAEAERKGEDRPPAPDVAPVREPLAEEQLRPLPEPGETEAERTV